MFKKPIIVFEGIEASGKTFHVKFLINYLKKKRISFIKLREPGGHINAEKIRKLILNNKSNFHKNTDFFLYLAARNENIQNIIKKNYRKKVIIIDRFIDSTLAYQHYGFGVDYRLINLMNENLIKGLKINLTFLNIVSYKNLILRLKKRKKLNRYDKFKINFYRRVQNGYISMYKKNKKKYKLIDSNLDISLNKKKIIQSVTNLLK